jgi:hypothetical protein
MIVTAVANAYIRSHVFTFGGILFACLILSLIVKESISNSSNPHFMVLHRALKVVWVPLTLAAALLFGQELWHIGGS